MLSLAVCCVCSTSQGSELAAYKFSRGTGPWTHGGGLRGRITALLGRSHAEAIMDLLPPPFQDVLVKDVGGSRTIGTSTATAAAAAAAAKAAAAVESLDDALEAFEAALATAEEADDPARDEGEAAAAHTAAAQAAARVQAEAEKVAALGAAAHALAAKAANADARRVYYLSECSKAVLDVTMGDSERIFIETIMAVKVYGTVASLCTFAEGKTLHTLLVINMLFDHFSGQQGPPPAWWLRVLRFAEHIGVQVGDVKAFVNERFIAVVADSVSSTGRVRLSCVCLLRG